MKRALIGVLILVAVVTISGCSFSFSFSKSSDVAHKNAQDIAFKNGSTITIKPTFLGFGADLKAKITGDEGVKNITIKNFSNDSVSFSWKGKVREETEKSKNEQAAYQEEYGSLPIGQKAPLPPEPEFLENEISGNIEIKNLAAADSLLLPALWPEGSLVVDDSGVIFLSEKTFNELVNNKESILKLSAIDDSLTTKLKIVDEEIKEGKEFLKSLITNQETNAEKNIYQLEAEDDFGSFKVSLNGQTKKVETIVASNWFGEYIILNNPDYPLVLKTTLNPMASEDGFNLKSAFSYQVTEINYGD